MAARGNPIFGGLMLTCFSCGQAKTLIYALIRFDLKRLLVLQVYQVYLSRLEILQGRYLAKPPLYLWCSYFNFNYSFVYLVLVELTYWRGWRMCWELWKFYLRYADYLRYWLIPLWMEAISIILLIVHLRRDCLLLLPQDSLKLEEVQCN